MRAPSVERWGSTSRDAAIGGMMGRIGSSVIADWLGWRVAVGTIGVICLIGAFVFRWAAPVSRSFVSRRHDLASFLRQPAHPETRRRIAVALLRRLPADGSLHHDLQLRELPTARASVLNEPVRGGRHFSVLHRWVVCLDLVWTVGRPAGKATGFLDTHSRLPHRCWNDGASPLI